MRVIGVTKPDNSYRSALQIEVAIDCPLHSQVEMMLWTFSSIKSKSKLLPWYRKLVPFIPTPFAKSIADRPAA